MSRRHIAQREWLVEDLEQIQRYFPGAELIEPLNMPFDIEAWSTRVQRERKIRAHSAGASEKRAGKCRLSASAAMLIPEEGQALLQKIEPPFFCAGVTQ